VKSISRFLYPRTGGAWAPFLAILFFVLTGVAALAEWPAKAAQPNAAPQLQERERSLGPVYFRWLNEDVAYLIDQDERIAFLRLTTNDERDKFVVQFWDRRNPPSGAPNAFKREHYRRLAYSNQHFASGVPGWQTDRGHIYILYGPPDDIETRPRDSRGSTETWLYRHVEGIGDNASITFVDTNGQGDFRISPGAPHPK
jgi:GWxTD domain-containing protein